MSSIYFQDLQTLECCVDTSNYFLEFVSTFEVRNEIGNTKITRFLWKIQSWKYTLLLFFCFTNQLTCDYEQVQEIFPGTSGSCNTNHEIFQRHLLSV